MFRRMTVPLIAVTVAMSCISLSSVNAAVYASPASIRSTQYNPRDECRFLNWEKYKINCDGWHVVIYNDSDFDLVPYGSVPISRKSLRIPAHSTDRNTRGWESSWGGPKDLRFYHVSPELSDDVYNPDAGLWWRGMTITTVSGSTTVSCGVMGKIFTIGEKNEKKIGCEVLNPVDKNGYLSDTTQEILIRYYSLEDGPWKKGP